MWWTAEHNKPENSICPQIKTICPASMKWSMQNSLEYNLAELQNNPMWNVFYNHLKIWL